MSHRAAHINFLILPDRSLKRESEVLALDKPQPRPLKGTRKLFHTKFDKRTKTGSSDGAIMIAGAMKTHLDPENEPDLCVLAPPVEQDRLTVFLEGPFSYFFRVSMSRVIFHNQRTEQDTF